MGSTGGHSDYLSYSGRTVRVAYASTSAMEVMQSTNVFTEDKPPTENCKGCGAPPQGYTTCAYCGRYQGRS